MFKLAYEREADLCDTEMVVWLSYGSHACSHGTCLTTYRTLNMRGLLFPTRGRQKLLMLNHIWRLDNIRVSDRPKTSMFSWVFIKIPPENLDLQSVKLINRSLSIFCGHRQNCLCRFAVAVAMATTVDQLDWSVAKIGIRRPLDVRWLDVSIKCMNVASLLEPRSIKPQRS